MKGSKICDLWNLLQRYSVEKSNDSIGVYLSFGNGSCLTFHIHVFTKHKSCSGMAWIVASIFFTV